MAGLRSVGLALVGAAGLALLSGGQPSKEQVEILPGSSSIRLAFSREHPIKGRLTGDLQISPGSSRSESVSRRPVLDEQAALGTVLATGFTPKNLHSQGLLLLASGKFRAATTTLEEAAARLPGDAALLNDLAVAYIEIDRQEGHPFNLLLALSAIHRALSQDPKLVQARFNRAWILTRLHLRKRAAEAWKTYLELDPGSSWEEEARRQFRSVTRLPLSERWKLERPRLFAAAARGDRTLVLEIVRRFPHLARIETEEEVLPAWGELLESGATLSAARHLAIVRALGDALFETTGDAMVLDALEALDRAARDGSSSRLEHLAAGHRSFGQGLRLYRSQNGDAAQPLLAQSARLLGEAGSPFAGWAEFYGNVCTHYADSESALQAFLHLRDETDTERYPVLAGLANWMIGTTENNLNHPERALAAFLVAQKQLAAIGAPETAGFLHVLFAETYERLGNVDQAWRERMAALKAAANGGDRRRVHSTLHEAAGAVQWIDPAIALDLVVELLDNNRAWGNAGALTEAFLLEGRTLERLGRHREALESFRSAQAWAASVGRGAQGDHIAGEVALAEGEVMVGLDPLQAVRRLTEALESAQERRFLYHHTHLLTTRARAYQALGDTDAAEADLLRAIEEHERIRGDLRNERLRTSYFEAAQVTFDAMIRLQAESRDHPRSAFAFAERSRARLLLDLTLAASAPGLPVPLDTDEILARISHRGH